MNLKSLFTYLFIYLFMPSEFLECLKFGGDIVMVFPLIPKTKEKEGEKKLKMRKGFAS
jgi:hypothetical protein